MKTRMKKIIIIFSVLVMMVVMCACGTIESGYTGVKLVDGIVQDTPMEPGRYGHLGKRVNIIRVNNKRQTITYSDVLDGESKEKVVVYAQNVSITYQINKDASVWMVKNINDNFQNNLLPVSMVGSSIKNALANITTDDCTNRSYVEPAVKQEIQSAVDEYYYPGAVTIINVSILKMDYEPDYNQQISTIAKLKKQAEAEALTNQMKIETAKAEAEAEATKAEAAKKTAEANAEVATIKAKNEAEIAAIKAESTASATLIEANAQAEANKKIADSLTPLFIDYTHEIQWNGVLPSVNGADGIIMNMETLNN